MHCEQFGFLALLYAEKTIEKVLVDWHDGTLRPEGTCVQLLVSPGRASTPAEFSCCQNQAPQCSRPPLGWQSPANLLSACGLRIGMEEDGIGRKRGISYHSSKTAHDCSGLCHVGLDALASFTVSLTSRLGVGANFVLRLQTEIELEAHSVYASTLARPCWAYHIEQPMKQVVTKVVA